MNQVIYYAHGSPARESGVVSDCDTMAELSTLLHSEIPEGRSNLTDNHTNLERVAEYCEANYFQSDSKRGALEETKNYTTQSLASVAYQINTLAYNFLQLLELQTSQLAEMESQMNHISQTVMIHKEKVARREIGVLTANKSTTRHYKIIAPAAPEKPIKYIRRAIDYNILDDIGHGARSGTPRGQNKGGLQRGNSQSGSMQALVGNNGVSMGQAIPGGVVVQLGQPGVGPAPTTKPPTPPSVTRTGSKVSVSGGTLSKGSNREYRTPPAVAPPQVPSHYAPNYPLGHPRRAPAGSDSNNSSGSGGGSGGGGGGGGPRGPGYSALPLGQQGQQMMSPPGAGPQVGMVHPMHQQHPQTPPPPPPPTASGNGTGLYGDHHNSMPPPPSPLTIPITTHSQTQQPPHHQITPQQQQQQQPMHFSSHSLLLPQHGPVPAGSLGMHTLSHHHQAQYLQSIQRSLGGAVNNRTSSISTTDGGGRGGGGAGGQNSPPLPPPPPPMGDGTDGDDMASVVHAAFGRPQGRGGRGGGGDGDNMVGGGGGVRPIVPDEEDLPGWVPKNYLEKVVAIYDYYADKDDELSFQESSVIYVLKKNDDGWWEGVMDGITGLFPGNYVEPCV